MEIVARPLSAPGKPVQWSLTASLVGPWFKAQIEPWALFFLFPQRKEVSESRFFSVSVRCPLLIKLTSDNDEVDGV